MNTNGLEVVSERPKPPYSGAGNDVFVVYNTQNDNFYTYVGHKRWVPYINFVLSRNMVEALRAYLLDPNDSASNEFSEFVNSMKYWRSTGRIEKLVLIRCDWITKTSPIVGTQEEGETVVHYEPDWSYIMEMEELLDVKTEI